MANEQKETTAKKPIGVDDYSLSRVTGHNWAGWLDITLTWTGFVIYPGGILFGFVLAQAFSFWNSMLLLTLGSLTVAVVSMFMGFIGYRERISYALTTRIGYGDRGSALPSFLMFIQNTGWCSVNLAALIAFFGDIPAVLKIVLIIFFMALFTVASRFGFHKGIKLLARVAVPGLIAICILVLFLAPRYGGGYAHMISTWVPPNGGSMAFGAGYSIAIGSWISGSAMSPDVTRFAKDGKGVVLGSLFSFIVGFFGLGFIGILLGVATGSAEIAPAFAALGIAPLAFVAILLAVWTTMQTQVYSTSLALTNVIRKGRVLCENISAVAVIIVASLMAVIVGLEGSFIAIIVLFGVIVPPVPGIIAVEYYLVRKMKTPENIDNFALINYRGLLSYAICIVVYVVLNVTGTTTWFFQTPIFAAIVHIVISSAYLFGGKKVQDRIDTAA